MTKKNDQQKFMIPVKYIWAAGIGVGGVIIIAAVSAAAGPKAKKPHLPGLPGQPDARAKAAEGVIRQSWQPVKVPGHAQAVLDALKALRRQ